MCGNNCGCGFGNNWWWIIILVLLFCNCGGTGLTGCCGGNGNGCGNGCGGFNENNCCC